jgi:acetyl esterase/lipase
VQQRAAVLPFPQAPDGIELRHLRAFVAVAEELNFGRAAERLYVSQPALSRQIRALEQLVGCELLRRSTHSVELTVAGEALLDRSRKLLADVDEAVSATLAVGGELLVRIGRMLAPMEGLITDEADLLAARSTFESLHEQFSPPAGTVVRPVTAGGVASLVASPGESRDPSVIMLHGGGYVLGSAFGYQPHAGALAAAAQAGVLVPDYRLAPEHPYPAAVNDTVAAYRGLLERGTAPQSIVFVGESAGGGLVMSALLAIKRDDLPLPGGAVLLCPWIDLTLKTSPSTGAPLMGEAEARLCAASYVGDHSFDDPIINPLRADLSGLPPMLIQAATGDARLADAKALTQHAQAAGVDVRLELYPVEAHSFQLFWSFLPEAADALEAAGAFIAEIAQRSASPERRARTLQAST